MMLFLRENNIITQAQYGFLKKLSTKNALVDFHEHVLKLLDENKMIGLGMFIDLAKAFDTVNHAILLEKLQLYGFQNQALALIASYLSNRTQIVIIDGVKSDPMDISCGVPQGSILGPLLFILYINDLPNCLKNSKPFIYADDTNLFTSNDTIQQLKALCQEDLDCISTWCKLNLLTINASKTGYLLMSSANKMFPFEELEIKNPPDWEETKTVKKQTKKKKEKEKTVSTITTTEVTKIAPSVTKTSIKTTVIIESPTDATIFCTSPPLITIENTNPLGLTIDGEQIKMEESTKFLGLMIHENLTWKHHVNTILKKIRKYVGIFAKLRHFVPQKVLVDLYNSLIYSHLIYCIEIWGSSNTNCTYLQPLFRLQKKLVRIISFSKFQEHALPLFKKLKILHIFDIFRLNMAIFSHSFQKIPIQYQIQKVNFVKESTKHELRSSSENKLVQHFWRSRFGESTMSNKIRIAWNAIPKEIAQIQSQESFKIQMKTFFLQNPTPYNNNCNLKMNPPKIKKVVITKKKN